MERENFISTLSRSGAPTPGRDFFFCNFVGKASRFGLFKSVKKFSFRLFSNSLRLGETDDGKSKISRHIRRSSAFREKPNRKIIAIFYGLMDISTLI